MDDFLPPLERGDESNCGHNGHDDTSGLGASDGSADPGPQPEGPEHGELSGPSNVAGSADGQPTSPLRHPGEDHEVMTVLRLLEIAQALDAPNFDNMRGLIRKAREIRATPAEMKALQCLLVVRSGWPAGVVTQLVTDERNRIDGIGVIGSVDEAKAAVIAKLLEDYEQLVWSGGSLYGYRAEACQ